MDAQYFDYAATCPARKSAIKAVEFAMNSMCGNPSSPHQSGRMVQKELCSQKMQLLDMMRCSDGQLVLCASASEANALVVQHVLKTYPDKKILYAVDTHQCIQAFVDQHEHTFEALPVGESGDISVQTLSERLAEDVALVCLTHVSHETGVVHNVAELAAACDRHGIACLIDGTQAIGHIPVKIDEVPCDWYTFAAHKYGGPLGCAGVFVKGQALQAMVLGGFQEYGMRAGTENTPALFGAVAALEESLVRFEQEHAMVSALNERFRVQLKEAIPDVLFPGASAEMQSPYILACVIPGTLASNVIELLSIEGFSIASGSACTSNVQTASPLLLAMGFAEDQALSCLRISFGHGNSEAAVDGLIQSLQEACKQSRA